jgi:uncharacterized membrane protein YedE/YeeE
MNKDNKNNNFLLRYAGLGFQFLLAIGIAVFAGMKIDQWLSLKMPLAVWVLPLLIIFGVIFRIIKDTSQKK